MKELTCRQTYKETHERRRLNEEHKANREHNTHKNSKLLYNVMLLNDKRNDRQVISFVA